jgi:hypothetical protein
VILLSTILLSFLVVLATIAAMAIGVLLGGRKISGSCGGIASGGCELCRGDSRNTPTREP